MRVRMNFSDRNDLFIKPLSSIISSPSIAVGYTSWSTLNAQCHRFSSFNLFSNASPSVFAHLSSSWMGAGERRKKNLFIHAFEMVLIYLFVQVVDSMSLCICTSPSYICTLDTCSASETLHAVRVRVRYEYTFKLLPTSKTLCLCIWVDVNSSLCRITGKRVCVVWRRFIQIRSKHREVKYRNNKQSIQKKRPSAVIQPHAIWFLWMNYMFYHVLAHRLLNGDAVIYYYFIGNCNGETWAHATKNVDANEKKRNYIIAKSSFVGIAINSMDICASGTKR